MSVADEKSFPETGDIVITTVKQVTNHGAYVTLDEYEGITGFLHISEVATGWIRNIERYIRLKQKIVLKVIRIDKNRSEIDLSLKQVSGEEKKSKIIEVKKNEKGYAFLDIIKTKLNMSNEQLKEFENKILEKYDFIYDFFENVAKKGIETIQNMEFSQDLLKAIEEESNKINIQFFEIRGIIEISSKNSDGIDVIKNIFGNVESNKSNSKVKITYIGAPKYRIVVTGENFKSAEKILNNSIEKIRLIAEKDKNISFNFIRQESKKILSKKT